MCLNLSYLETVVLLGTCVAANLSCPETDLSCINTVLLLLFDID